MSEYLVVPEDRVGLELDEFLALAYPDLSKGFLRGEVRAGRVLVGGSPARPSQRLCQGDVLIVEIDEDEAPLAPAPAERWVLPVLHEDDDVVVVDKPPGLATEPERWAKESGSVIATLVDAVQRAAAEGGLPPYRPRLVHRLDKDTSGALVAAKHIEAERLLRQAFERGDVRKRYLALVEGEHPLADGAEEVVDLPLGPDPRKSGRQRVDAEGKPSRTAVRVAERFRGFTLLACAPLTGRTHQIRVHLAETGFPLAVDPLYGRRDALRLSELKSGYRAKPGRPERPLVERLTLHAQRIDLPTPSGDRLVVDSPLPSDLARALKQLAKVRPPRR